MKIAGVRNRRQVPNARFFGQAEQLQDAEASQVLPPPFKPPPSSRSQWQ